MSIKKYSHAETSKKSSLKKVDETERSVMVETKEAGFFEKPGFWRANSWNQRNRVFLKNPVSGMHRNTFSEDTGMQKSFGRLISELAQVNIALWHEEDKARLDDDHIVAHAKRRIDKLNQQRNDYIEQLDELAVEAVSQ